MGKQYWTYEHVEGASDLYDYCVLTDRRHIAAKTNGLDRAQLFAAAPDLLNSLYALLLDPDQPEYQKAAKDAIFKATGQEFIIDTEE